MAKKKANPEGYISKAAVSSIRFTSRASVKIGESFYTVEACEEHVLPMEDDLNIEQERKILWDVVNTECDKQIEDIIKTFRK